METKQTTFWSGDFGKEYTDRNTVNHEDWDANHVTRYGIKRTELNERFLGHLPKDARILEVGCNTGQQLEGLQKQGFTNLYGIELQWYASKMANQRLDNVNIIQGSGFDIPYKDNYFDLVFTNGVLIHINPNDLPKIMGEIYRCSKRYIFGLEYYAGNVEEINYRGNEDYLWKADYCGIYKEYYPNLKVTRKEQYPYLDDTEAGNVDCMYLLEKG